MFLVSLMEVLMEVILVYDGPPVDGLAQVTVGPQAPPVAAFLWVGVLTPKSPPLSPLMVTTET